jgi:hypothetical protein
MANSQKKDRKISHRIFRTQARHHHHTMARHS